MSTKVLLLNYLSILSHNNNACIISLRKGFVLNYISCFYKNPYSVIGRKIIFALMIFLYYNNSDITWESLTFQRWRQSTSVNVPLSWCFPEDSHSQFWYSVEFPGEAFKNREERTNDPVPIGRDADLIGLGWVWAFFKKYAFWVWEL